MDRRAPSSRIALLTLLAFGLASAPVLAGNDQWTVVGQPFGGPLFHVAVDPVTTSTLYAISTPGVFESTDAGAHWSLALSLPWNNVSDVEIEPENHTTVWVATEGEGVYKSTDAGKTWTAVNNGIPDLGPGDPSIDSIARVTVDPVNDGVAYAITLNHGIYKTVDGGADWAAANTGLGILMAQGMHNMTALAVDPAHPNVLYMTADALASNSNGGAFASDASTGLYMSTNGGGSWTQSLTSQPFSEVIIDPSNDQNVYAGGANLFVSNNGGGSWTQATGTAATVQGILTIDPTNSNNMWGTTIFGGLYRSTDGGTTWSAMPAGDAGAMSAIALDPVTPTIQYATATFGLDKSTDGGTTWAESDTGIYGITTNMMFMDASGEIYLGADGTGVYKSGDDGASWTRINNGISFGTYGGIYVYGLTEDPKAAATLYAGTPNGLFKTTDGGSNWSLLSNGLTDAYTMSVAVDPENSLAVYAGTQSSGVFKSIDGGSSWQASTNGITDPDVIALAVNPADSNTVFAGTFTNGLFKSSDGGATWSAVTAGLPAAGVWAIAFDPKTPSIVYISLTNQDIYKSTDGGNTWASASNGLPVGALYTAIQIDPSDTSILYVSPLIGAGDVYVSGDGGADWEALASGVSAQAQTSRAVRARMPAHGIASYSKSALVQRVTGVRTQSSSSTVSLGAVAADPRSKMIYGADQKGEVYAYDVTKLPSPSSSGGSSSGSSSSSGGGGGGGGAVSLFSLLLLLGLGSARRRRG